MFRNSAVAFCEMSWSDTGGRPTRTQPHTIHGFDEREQKRSRLAQGRPPGPSAAMLRTEVKKEEKVVHISIPPASLRSPEY